MNNSFVKLKVGFMKTKKLRKRVVIISSGLFLNFFLSIFSHCNCNNGNSDETENPNQITATLNLEPIVGRSDILSRSDLVTRSDIIIEYGARVVGRSDATTIEGTPYIMVPRPADPPASSYEVPALYLATLSNEEPTLSAATVYGNEFRYSEPLSAGDYSFGIVGELASSSFLKKSDDTTTTTANTFLITDLGTYHIDQPLVMKITYLGTSDNILGTVEFRDPISGELIDVPSVSSFSSISEWYETNQNERSCAVPTEYPDECKDLIDGLSAQDEDSFPTAESDRDETNYLEEIGLSSALEACQNVCGDSFDLTGNCSNVIDYMDCLFNFSDNEAACDSLFDKIEITNSVVSLKGEDQVEYYDDYSDCEEYCETNETAEDCLNFDEYITYCQQHTEETACQVRISDLTDGLNISYPKGLTFIIPTDGGENGVYEISVGTWIYFGSPSDTLGGKLRINAGVTIKIPANTGVYIYDHCDFEIAGEEGNEVTIQPLDGVDAWDETIHFLKDTFPAQEENTDTTANFSYCNIINPSGQAISMCSGTSFVMSHCKVMRTNEEVANGVGNLLFVKAASIQINNNLFLASQGGGINFQTQTQCALDHVTLDFYNNTIVDSGEEGLNIYPEGGELAEDYDIMVANNIISGSNIAIPADLLSLGTRLQYNDIYTDGSIPIAGIPVPPFDAQWYENNHNVPGFGVDPLFTDPDNYDYSVQAPQVLNGGVDGGTIGYKSTWDGDITDLGL